MGRKNKRMYSQNATVPVCHLTQVWSRGISPNCVQVYLYAGCLSNEIMDLSYFSSQRDRQTAPMTLQPKGRVLSPSYYKLKATNSLYIFRLFILGIKTEQTMASHQTCFLPLLNPYSPDLTFLSELKFAVISVKSVISGMPY